MSPALSQSIKIVASQESLLRPNFRRLVYILNRVHRVVVVVVVIIMIKVTIFNEDEFQDLQKLDPSAEDSVQFRP